MAGTRACARRGGWAVLAALMLATLGCSDDPATNDAPAATAAPDTSAPRATSTTEPATTTEPAPTATDVTFTYRYEPPDGNVDDWIDSLGVTPTDPANGVLGRANVHGVMRYDGDVAGTGTYVFAGSEHPSGIATGGMRGVSISRLSGTVADCGEGTAVVVSTSGTWRFLPGYGTGDLASLTGSGTSIDQLGFDAGEGTMTGTVSCDGSAETDADDDEPSPAGSPSTFTVAWSPGELIVDPGVTGWGLDEATDPAPDEPGLAHGHGTVHLSGPLLGGIGRQVWVAVEHPDGSTEGGATGVSLIQLSGSVPGCGPGTMLLELTVGYPQGAYSWRIVDGHGTGVLADASGGGRGTTGPVDVDNLSGSLELEGSIDCTPADRVQPQLRATGFDHVLGAVQPDGEGGLWAATSAEFGVGNIEHRAADGSLLVSIPAGLGGMGVLPWVAGPDGVLVDRVDLTSPQQQPVVAVHDPATGAERGRAPVFGSLALGDGRGWVLAGDQLVAISLTDASELGRMTLPRNGDAIAFADGSVWVGALDAVWRIDPDGLRIIATVPANGQGLVVAEDAIWAINEITGEALRIDPRANRTTGSVQLQGDHSPPIEVATGGGALWSLASIETDELVPSSWIVQMVGLTDERARLPVAATGIASDDAGVWLTGSDGLVYWLDPAGMGVTAP